MTRERDSSKRQPTGARRMVQTFAATLGAEATTRLVLLLAAVVAVRVLQPEVFGEFVYAVAVASLAVFLLDFGLVSLVSRDISADAREAPAMLGGFLKAQIALATVSFLLGVGSAQLDLLGGPASPAALSIAFGAAALGSLARPFEAVLTGLGRPHFVALGRGVRGAVLLAGTFLVAIVSPTAENFLLALAVSSLAGAVAAARFCIGRVIRPHFTTDLTQVGRLLRVALPFAMLTGFNILYARVDLLMLGQFTPESVVGNYGVAIRIIETVVVIPALIGAAFLVTVAQTGSRSRRAAAQAEVASRNALLLCIPIAFILGMGATPITSLVAGGEYDTADTALLLLSPMIALVAAYCVLANLQVANNQLGTLIRINVAGLAAKVAMNFYAIPTYGLEGAAVTAVLGEAVVVAAQWFSARHVLRLGPLLRDGARFAICGATMTLVGMVTMGLYGLWLGLILGLAGFVACGVLLRCVTTRELIIAVKALRPAAS